MTEGKPFVDTGKLIETKEAFNHCKANDKLFESAMNEALHWHSKRCSDFNKYVSLHGLAEPKKKTVLSTDIPPLLVTIFKHHKLISIPENKVKIELTSSGTGGQKSAIVLDNRSYKRIQKIVDNIFSSLGLVDRTQRVNYLCFTYDPKKAGSVGTAFSDKMLTGLTKKRSVFYAIKWKEAINDFEFDLKATVRKLIAFNERPEPTRILGFPAYLWQVCDELERREKKLTLGKGSYIITGGGWKMHANQQVTKEVFKKRVEKILGIPQKNVRDLFGMVEHGIPYVDCECGNLHVPIYARARVLDPESLKPLDDGEVGLLHLMTPYLSSYPSISLLTTDKAVIENNCPCGRKGKTFKILGRAGLAKHKGCAIKALDLLK